MITRLRRSFAGASEYVGGVFVAVLLLPIAPDVAIDFFGGPAPSWRNPALRVGALIIVVLLVLVRYRARERARIRSARGGTMTGLGQAQVLALALSPERKNPDKPTYTPPARRRDHPSGAELLIDTVRPRKVLAVVTPQFADTDLARFTAALREDGIELVVVRIDDGTDPSVAVSQTAERLVQAAPAADTIYVDVTGGTKAMTLGMVRAASILGADCVYVASQFKDGRMLPGNPKPYNFNPRDMFSPIP